MKFRKLPYKAKVDFDLPIITTLLYTASVEFADYYNPHTLNKRTKAYS